MRIDDAARDAIRDLYDDLEIDGRVLDLGGAGMEHFTVPPDELTVAGEADGAYDDVVYFGAPDDPELFANVARALKPGGRFVITFTNRLAPDTTAQVRLLRKRFDATPGFGPAESDLRTSLRGTGDQLWAVWAAATTPDGPAP
jgi:SAM-dependent methyltransferase